MKSNELPLGQHEIDHILKWNREHPGIIPRNPKADLDTWTLTLRGEVRTPMSLKWQDILALPTAQSTGDFHCVEGWSVRNCRWHGVKLDTIFGLVKPSETARYVLFKCSDGYTTSFPIQELLGDDVLLAYKLNGEPLEEPLGGPLRLVFPKKYAYKSAMWIEQIVFSRTEELGFWERRGYSNTADVGKNDRFAR
jgi:DMSO/TMAO reductase YedYZ molybdopterin-dependent catalytic subunit